jgi:hypothetical protein
MMILLTKMMMSKMMIEEPTGESVQLQPEMTHIRATLRARK